MASSQAVNLNFINSHPSAAGVCTSNKIDPRRDGTQNCGLIGATATARLLTSMLFGVPPKDGVTFVTVSIALLVVCLTATYFPARRAMKVDPLIALRYE